MRIKPGANFEGLTPIMKEGCRVIERVYNRYGYELWLTSGKDGKHMDGSKHYEGNAGDFRTFIVRSEDLPLIVADCKKELGPDFDVILEADHLHAEYDPKLDFTNEETT